MKVTVEIVDFGEVTVGPSPDNPGLIRIAIDDTVGDRAAHMDLDEVELSEFIRAIRLVSEDDKPKKVCR